MEVVVLGTGDPGGVPPDGCGCPACLAARTDPAQARSPAALLLDRTVRLTAGDATEHRGAGGDRLLWLPAADDLTDDAVSALGTGSAARYAVLAARTPAGAARALARLRAAGAVDDGTACALAGHRHDWPAAPEVLLRARHWGVAVPRDGDLLAPAGPGSSDRLPRRTLVLGGIRSGKSALAEDLLAAEPSVLYLAAGATPAEGSEDGAGDRPDREWARRVAAHRARRPPWWRTVESTDLEVARSGGAPVLLDSVGSWLTAALDAAGAWTGAPGWQDRYLAGRDRLLQAWRATSVPVVAVAEEVGGGLLPGTASGRLFTDELGRLNQLLAASSEQVLLCVAGRTVPVASPWSDRTASSAGADPRAGA